MGKLTVKDVLEWKRTIKRGDLVALTSWSLNGFMGWGYVERRGNNTITLSDGRKYRSDDGLGFNEEAHGTMLSMPREEAFSTLGEPPPCDVMTRERSNRLKKIERELKKSFKPEEAKVERNATQANEESKKAARNSTSPQK